MCAGFFMLKEKLAEKNRGVAYVTTRVVFWLLTVNFFNALI